jgi:hypothetical protein
MKVCDKEIDEALRIVGNAINGIKISETVDTLATSCNILPPQARYIVRAVIDRCEVHTDSKFRLHLNKPQH